jgi:hypothetical protein
MSKDRTKRQNFELIKGLIESENELDILEILKKENLTLWGFFTIFKNFVLVNYLNSDTEKRQRRKVSLYLVRKGIYKSENGARSSERTLIDRGLNLTNIRFKVSTYMNAIDKLSMIKENVIHVKKRLDLYGAMNDTYSDEFMDFCKKYNLLCHNERKAQRRFYKITSPEKKKVIKKIVFEDGEEIIFEKKETFIEEKRRLEAEKKALELQRKENERISILFLKKKKARIKMLKDFSKSHYEGRTYTQKNILELEKMDCLTNNSYDQSKVLLKLQKLES